jgi:CheY-like chemotaxis protein
MVRNALPFSLVVSCSKALSRQPAAYDLQQMVHTPMLAFVSSHDPLHTSWSQDREGDLMGNRPSVVVIEDDTSIRELILETLLEEGYDVTGVSNGRGAVAIVTTITPQLILLDRHLGDADAAYVLTTLRAEPSLTHIPVILMSASATVHDEAAALGVEEALAKPFTLENLVYCVASLAPRPLCQRQAEA